MDKQRYHLICLFTFFLAAPLCCSAVQAASVAMMATEKDGKIIPQVVVSKGASRDYAWVLDGKKRDLWFRPSTPNFVITSETLYLAVNYSDECQGRLRVHFNGTKGANMVSDRALRGAPSNTGGKITAMFRLCGLKTLPGERDKPVLHISLEHLKGVSLGIQSVVLQDQPFEDAQFKYLLSDPWMGPYTGPSVKAANNTTLRGKVMAGYQGWFRTPNDPYGNGWFHWGDISNGTFCTDMWPDVSQYPSRVLERAGEINTRSGKPGMLFSSAWPEVTDIHFRWMRENDIDGVFLQRFVRNDFYSISGGEEWVLANVRASANREGRIWAIEYDVSGYSDDKILKTLKKDWMWMVDVFGLLKDPNYARENGKPVVFIWGLPFPDRHFTAVTSNAVVDFFKHDPKYGGNYVIGGIPGNWRTLDANWQGHFKKYDSALAWMSRDFARDNLDFARMGVTYYPHVKPGFSWANLMHIPTGLSNQYEPREGGKTYWNYLTQVAQAKCDRLFAGMFDEYDEGTAIMPMSDDAPPTPSRPGVAAEFYKEPDFHGKPVILSQPNVSLSVGVVSPLKNIPANNFCVRWIGQIAPPRPGEYVFTVEGALGDSVKLMINDRKLLDVKQLFPSKPLSGKLVAAPGEKLTFQLDYKHGSAAGNIRLLWSGPGVLRQPVPDSVLTDAWGRFLTNDGFPSDHWLKLTRFGKEMLNGKRPAGFPMPLQ